MHDLNVHSVGRIEDRERNVNGTRMHIRTIHTQLPRANVSVNRTIFRELQPTNPIDSQTVQNSNFPIPSFTSSESTGTTSSITSSVNSSSSIQINYRNSVVSQATQPAVNSTSNMPTHTVIVCTTHSRTSEQTHIPNNQSLHNTTAGIYTTVTSHSIHSTNNFDHSQGNIPRTACPVRNIRPQISTLSNNIRVIFSTASAHPQRPNLIHTVRLGSSNQLDRSNPSQTLYPIRHFRSPMPTPIVIRQPIILREFYHHSQSRSNRPSFRTSQTSNRPPQHFLTAYHGMVTTSNLQPLHTFSNHNIRAQLQPQIAVQNRFLLQPTPNSTQSSSALGNRAVIHTTHTTQI